MDERILVVDDEKDICEILGFNLSNEGYRVDTATSAEEALRKATPEHALILLDVMMGGMSGYKMAEKLRHDGNRIPIIFLTAKDTENDMLTGFSVGGVTTTFPNPSPSRRWWPVSKQCSNAVQDSRPAPDSAKAGSSSATSR